MYERSRIYRSTNRYTKSYLSQVQYNGLVRQLFQDAQTAFWDPPDIGDPQ